jgi:hypothetical protein
MILESIVTTCDEAGGPVVSPMGPSVNEHWSEFVLRPFQTSRTFANLVRHGEGVVHVCDNVELFALAATGRLPKTVPVRAATAIRGWILDDACRWYAFRVLDLDDSDARSVITCEVVDQGRQRDFFGFNRAKHAVIEAAILATRLDWLPHEQVLAEYQRLASPVEKTAGEQERLAFAMLQDYVMAKVNEQ